MDCSLFYYKNKPLCYLNASHKHQFVGRFCKRISTKTKSATVADNGRNTVKSLRYFSLEEINNEILISVSKKAIFILKKARITRGFYH
jgi:hypothetical protein